MESIDSDAPLPQRYYNEIRKAWIYPGEEDGVFRTPIDTRDMRVYAKETVPEAWLLVPQKEYRWKAAGNHRHRTESLDSHRFVDAVVFMADGNMGGDYFRVFWWFAGDKSPYFNTLHVTLSQHSGSINSRNTWFISKPFNELGAGDIVEDTLNPKRYIVSDASTEYIKVLVAYESTS